MLWMWTCNAGMRFKPRMYWVFRYLKGSILREPKCGDCEARGCRGECCGGCGW
jgi:hypothetical protein